ncbi:hypothetical protein D791_03264 [Nitrincola nitratireducens]|uniref:Uncharacterized protein n=1 Tax=Nitrincola nitratireducens TaxID=1229521 RepID=W9URN5_9GAMM|nr:hypothetical protein D791_03264 [Nitrincola nitratireducens]
MTERLDLRALNNVIYSLKEAIASSVMMFGLNSNPQPCNIP